jgi:hypothetical protein
VWILTEEPSNLLNLFFNLKRLETKYNCICLSSCWNSQIDFALVTPISDLLFYTLFSVTWDLKSKLIYNEFLINVLWRKNIDWSITDYHVSCLLFFNFFMLNISLYNLLIFKFLFFAYEDVDKWQYSVEIATRQVGAKRQPFFLC